MRETLTSKVLRLDREMRSAIASYAVALTFFIFYGIVRLMTLMAIFNWYNLIMFVLMASLSTLSINAIVKVKRMQKELAKNPKKFVESKSPKGLSITTFFPFTRNAS